MNQPQRYEKETIRRFWSECVDQSDKKTTIGVRMEDCGVEDVSADQQEKQTGLYILYSNIEYM